jgi:membrane protein DedA with SNARE-associated domain
VWRFRTIAVSLLVPGLLHIHLHHRFHGPPFDYVGLAVAAGASWVGLPGPGEPLLFAAALLAARHQLDLSSVLVVAFVAATAGGIVGWLIGLKAGRAVFIAPGPLRAVRVRMVARGEAIFERHPVSAILLTPAFVAGINRVPSRIYQPINAISALVWTLGIGVGGYYLGPPVLDFFGDLGTGLAIVAIAVVVGLVVLELIRRRRQRSATAGSSTSRSS